LPPDPHSNDASFLHAADTLLPPLADAFRAGVVVLHCDAHVLDPLTHLRCTTSLCKTPCASSGASRTSTANGRSSPHERTLLGLERSAG
jgi:hypothetical protein